MNQIIVQVFLPANGMTYDVRVPENMYVHDMCTMLAELFTEAAKGFYAAGSTNILCFQEVGRSLPHEKTLKELGIQNKTRLMFV